MKGNINLIVFVLILFSMGCGHYLENAENYTPPTLKTEPNLFYPRAALENSFSGTPRVILYISKTGTVVKAAILKTSGIGVLDSAAIEYSKNFIFNPAQISGEPVNSRMAMDIKFEISDNKWNAGEYVKKVKDLYEQLSQAEPEDRNEIETEIFKMHNEFTKNMKDLINYNKFIGQVILPGTNSEWKNDWNTWPLSFLLYHDFIQRFPDYYNLEEVKKELLNSLKYNIQYIKSTPAKNRVSKLEKEIILSKIKNLVESKYPDIINEIGLDIKVDSVSVF